MKDCYGSLINDLSEDTWSLAPQLLTLLQEEREERLTVGKLRLGGVWEDPKEDEPRREVVR